MSREHVERFQRLEALDVRVARAAAELDACRGAANDVPAALRVQLESLADELQALHLLVSNEVEKAWSAAEIDARRTRRGQIMGRVADAVSAETSVPSSAEVNLWPKLGTDGPETSGD